MTPGYSKNVIRRCFRELVDHPPTPEEQILLWEYFASSCAFCGAQLDRLRGQGHLDHLVPAANGGANHISNRVLSCVQCNSKEKSNQDWEPFLLTKCAEVSVFDLRKEKIESWIRANTVEAGDGLLTGLADEAATRVIAIFDSEVEALRRMKHVSSTRGLPRASRRKAVRDSETGKEYPSLTAAGRALAGLVNGDPADHYVWYAIERAFPGRFQTVVDGTWTNRGASPPSQDPT